MERVGMLKRHCHYSQCTPDPRSARSRKSSSKDRFQFQRQYNKTVCGSRSECASTRHIGKM